MSLNLKQNIKALRKGNELAGFQLYQHFSKATYNSILRIVPQEDEARDLLQESFIQAFEKINELDNELAFGAWLKRIAINKALAHLRKQKPLALALNEPEIMDQSEAEVDIPSLPFAEIKAAIDQLPEGCRLVFQLYYLEEYNHAQIAAQLKVSVSNSKTQLRYARRLLQKKLKAVYET